MDGSKPMNERVTEAKPSAELARRSHGLIDLTEPRLGSAVVFASDDFFAPKERLIDPRPPVFIADKYDDHGKWMDGWESRRKRNAGHDHAIVRLGRPGRIRLIDIDTSHFTGNFPPAASIAACQSTAEHPDDGADWREIVPSMALSGDAHHLVEVADDGICSHLRLDIYPDGGIARLRVFGEVHRDWTGQDPDAVIDLAAMENGGRAIAWADAHYGNPNYIVAPGRGRDMGDGWETRRRREPGNDWIIVALGHPGRIGRAVVDTAHYKGNYPDRCSIQGARVAGGTVESLTTQSMFWPTLLAEQPLSADHEHAFDQEIADIGPVSHVRLNIFPDGGVSRLRLYGTIVGS